MTRAAFGRAVHDTDHLSDLLALERAGLMALWRARFASAPPKNVQPEFLRRALGFALQCATEGDVAAGALKSLRRIASAKCAAPGSAAALRPGACLMREWNGRTYRVEVIEGGGFLMDGKTYRSLSAIARHITGAHWSGPRFFGIG